MRAAQWLLALAMAAATWMTFSVPDAEAFREPKLARIIFFHLPCAFITTIFLFAGAFYSIRYLRRRNWTDEIKAVTANELAGLFGVLTMTTGILFSKVQWGEWWQWDPRQTSFLLLLMLIGAYFALRVAFSGEQRRAANSAAYSAAMLLPAIFLIFVFPRLRGVQSFHPNQTITSGGFDRTYGSTILTVGVLLFIVAIWFFRLRVRVSQAELTLEAHLERMDDRGRPTDTGVVGPVPVPVED
jgi:heme exporter protein C